jgi:hypothetical protein
MHNAILMTMAVGPPTALLAPAPEPGQTCRSHRQVQAEQKRWSVVSRRCHGEECGRKAGEGCGSKARDESVGDSKTKRVKGCRVRRTYLAAGFSARQSACGGVHFTRGTVGFPPASSHAALGRSSSPPAARKPPARLG